MGAWGITVRQSDDGLDLLDTIVAEQLRNVNFTVFNVSEAITLLNQTIQEEIEQYKQKPPSKITDFYISETLMHDFINAALLVAECLYDYYQTGELVVYDYIGENYDPVEYQILFCNIADLLPVVEHADGGLSLEIVDLKSKRSRVRLLRRNLPEYLLTVTRWAVVIIKGYADDPVNTAVESGSAGILPRPALTVGGGSPLPLLGGGALGLLRLPLELAFFHEAVYQHTDTDRVENNK